MIVHTWASFFLRHLVNMSFMVPFWASTDSGSVPISGSPCPKPCCPEEVVYSPNDSCSHFTQRLFPPSVPWQRTVIFHISLKYPIIARTHIRHHIICTFTSFILHILFTSLFLLIFMAGWLPSAPCVRYSYVCSKFQKSYMSPAAQNRVKLIPWVW